MTNISQTNPPPKLDVGKRGVDHAMAAQRPAKATVRKYWADEAESFHDRHANEPFPIYTTLSGAEAHDILTIIDRRVIRLTETGAIHPDDLHKVVAIEASPPAVLQLQKRLPGLQILEQDFKSLIRGETPLVFPDSPEHKRCCCASIVNLDLNTSLVAREEGLTLTFPLFSWIQKLSQIHATGRPGVDWCLCLTMHAQIDTPQIVAKHIQQFLKENFETSAEFEESCRGLLGDQLHTAIKDDSDLDLTTLSVDEVQKLLMVFVPKKIARLVNGHGWKVSTVKNLSYGGTEGHAPMITWIFYFLADARAAAQPQTVYTESLNEILTNAGSIDPDGTVNDYR